MSSVASGALAFYIIQWPSLTDSGVFFWVQPVRLSNAHGHASTSSQILFIAKLAFQRFCFAGPLLGFGLLGPRRFLAGLFNRQAWTYLVVSREMVFMDTAAGFSAFQGTAARWERSC